MVYGLRPPAIARLCQQRQRHFQRCRWIGDELKRAGASLMSPGFSRFPHRLLRDLRDPPPMLFALGNRSILDRPCVAVLSSREIRDHTLAATVAVILAAREVGFTTAIGGMKSTHRLAAISTRASEVMRIVVLDRGLFAAFASDFRSDPFGCGGRRTPLDRRSTLVLSSFRPEDHAAPNSGRRRDELIAALGDVIFVGSARAGGVTERICLEALSRGKPVLVWHQDGNGALERAGAQPIDGAALAIALKRFQATGLERAVRRASRQPYPQLRPRRGRRRRSHGE